MEEREFTLEQMETGKMLDKLDKNVIPDKKAIRKAALAAREALGGEERKRGSLLLTERVLGHQWFYGSEEILCFVSYGSEIDTGEIMTEALRLGKRVYVPKVLTGEDNEVLQYNMASQSYENLCYKKTSYHDKTTQYMDFFRIENMSQLKAGYRGILEPSGDSERYVYTSERAGRTLMLMPGAAFDSFRNRLGYGGGFYDRYLADREALQLRTIAVGFKCQMVEEIPAESTDIRPCQVICV